VTSVPATTQEPQTGEHVAIAPAHTSEPGHPSNVGGRRRSRRSRVLFNGATVLVTAAFSYYALSHIDLALAWRSTRASDLWWLLASLLAFALGVQARAFRWRSLFARGRRPPLGVVTNAMLVGYLYNNVMPARAGEAARVVVLTQRSSTATAEILGTVVLERMYDVVALLVVFFAAEPWLPHVSWFGAAAVAALVLAAAIVAAATVLAVFGDRPLHLLVRPLRRISPLSGERLDAIVAELTHGLSGLRHPGLALEAFVWTLAAWLLTALSSYLVALAFHLHVPLSSGVLVAVAVGLGMILPSAPAAVGVFETAALIALAAYGIPHSAALPYAVVLHLVNFVPFVVVGALVLHHNSRHPKRAASARAGS
jgi:uncharacterized protein (TIRG00374 family)